MNTLALSDLPILFWFLRYKPKTAFNPYVLYLDKAAMFFVETENKTQTLF